MSANASAYSTETDQKSSGVGVESVSSIFFQPFNLLSTHSSIFAKLSPSQKMIAIAFHSNFLPLHLPLDFACLFIIFLIGFSDRDFTGTVTRRTLLGDTDAAAAPDPSSCLKYATIKDIFVMGGPAPALTVSGTETVSADAQMLSLWKLSNLVLRKKLNNDSHRNDV
ncbi:hypothetical protein PsorP6_008619 [Peronosclerospora sorghi]|uniref:Uncharacterized protein n=1 Tax=Peronosclerospora sorghi TaxID=230839 RepID=A0ACC0WD61_9STRA|nr:hypothetical protein PsorP6_008619 [Peronosclerospora sorghi]